MTGTLSPILVTNRADNYSNHHMLEGLHEGFKALGYKSQLHLIGQDGTGLDAFLEALPDPTSEQGQNSFLVDLNARMRLPQTHPLKKFSFITDHPFALLEQILASPPRTILGYVDRSHATFLDALQLPHRRTFFPHGGPQPDIDFHPIEHRTVDALFIGRLDHSPRLADLQEGLKGNPEPIPRVVQQTAERSLTGLPLFEAFVSACNDANVELKDFGLEGLRSCLSIASNWVEARRRHDILTSMGNVKITLAGSVRNDFFQTTPPNIDFLGTIPFTEAQAKIRQAKILLNVVGVFPDGSHERIWYGMAAGCPILTERGRLLEEDFVDGESIFFWPTDPEQTNDFVSGLLADPNRLETAASTALPIYSKRHTWTQRAATILDSMAVGDE